jgi:MATE family multidrug resistance protein
MIACLKSTPAYATLGVTNTLLHFIVKIAEALSVGTIVLTGQYNGMQDFKKAGSVLINAFWSTVIVGAVIAGGLFFGAHAIYYWYGVPNQMIELGIPFLQLRAVGIFFTFVYFAFIGFLRGVKNTQIPMITFVVGSVVFLFFDYVLIFGKCGFPELQLQGSAWATVIQYGFMCAASILYVLFSPEMKRYAINLFSYFTSLEQVKQLFALSWPVVR